MLFEQIFDPFLQNSPISVMARCALEYALPKEALDALFAKIAKRQYTRELLFSTVVDVMSLVVCKKYPSVHAAYQDLSERIPVSISALYAKLDAVEPDVSAEIVHQIAQQLGPVIQQMKATLRPELPGYRLKIVDGNHLAATQHRLKVLRKTRAAPLPGQALVILDPELSLATQVIPCEDGHAQERSMTEPLLECIQAEEVVIADRNLCTAPILFGIDNKGSYFIIRQHSRNPAWEPLTEPRRVMRIDTGVVYEQKVVLLDESDHTLEARRIILELDTPTRDGDTEIHILTNLPIYKVGAHKIAKLYQKRWTLETLFGELDRSLKAEIDTLCYPKAALLGFCVGLMTYNVLSVLRAALRARFGQAEAQEVSMYYLADQIGGTYRGMMIAIPVPHWVLFQRLSASDMAQILVELAEKVRLAAFRRHPRGPKKVGPKKKYVSAAEAKSHVSTARLLAAASQTAP